MRQKNGFQISCWILLCVMVLSGCHSRLTRPTGRPGKEPNIDVCLTENIQNSTLAFKGTFILKLEEALYYLDESVGTLNVVLEGKNLILKNKKRYFELSHNQTLVLFPKEGDLQSRFLWDKTPYAGKLFIVLKDGRATAVNTLGMEKYLEGVIPFEIPTYRKEYRAAVMAQAIAARSYAIHRIEHSVSRQYDIYADTRDQVYKGASKNTRLSQSAIEETRGILLMDHNKPAKAFYHSTSGGVLESASPKTAGLKPRGVSFKYDFIDGDFNDRVSPLYRWIEVRDAETILKNINREFKLKPAVVQKWLENGFEMDLAVKKRHPSGRVAEMRVTIAGNDFLVRGYQVRRVFSDASGKALPSSFFFMNISPSEPEKFYLIGAGAGHGRGMSQWGAIGMALKGFSYQKILAFYYPGWNLYRWY